LRDHLQEKGGTKLRLWLLQRRRTFMHVRRAVRCTIDSAAAREEASAGSAGMALDGNAKVIFFY